MKRLIITILALFLVVGVVFSITDIVTLIADKNVINEPIIEIPEEELYTELIVHNFDNITIEDSYMEGSRRYFHNYEDLWIEHGKNPEFGISLLGSYTEKEFVMQSLAGSTAYDNYAFLGPSQNIEDGYLCIVFDIDVKLENWNGECNVGLQPNYQKADNKNAYVGGTLARFYSDGVFKNTYGEVYSNNVPDEFHYTYILWADGRANIYIDGDLVYQIPKAYEDSCTHFDSFRISVTWQNTTEQTESSVTVDDLKIKTFEIGYDGDINYLYNDPNVDLHDNPDTVLGGGY